MTCSYPRCECMSDPKNCVFKEENRRKVKRRMNDQISTQMADAVVQLDEQGKPKEITTQSPEVTGVVEEVTVDSADTERSSYTPVVI